MTTFSQISSSLGPFGIAIVAPSGRAVDDGGVERAEARLRSGGRPFFNYYDPKRAVQRFGASDEERLAQLYEAADNPAVQVVMALRGGYGLTRLLPQIDFERLAASGKIFCGFSDFTALQMGLFAKCRRQSYAGPMFHTDFGPPSLDAFTLTDFVDCLTGPQHVLRGAAPGNPDIDVEGTVWGGNLAMLASLAGTDYFPDIDGGILFLEDVGEQPFRIERMVLHLMHSGVLGRQRALVLGKFSPPEKVDTSYGFDAMLRYLGQTLPIPVLRGLEFSHGLKRVTIPFGATGRLKSRDGAFELTLRNYPTLSTPVPARAA